MIPNLPNYLQYRTQLLNQNPEYNYPLKIVGGNREIKNYPKISIITPSYNQGQYLEKTIQSVLNQNYPNVEYIIIDGGSTDESINIINKYKNQVSFAVSEKDRGQSHAINKGFSLASGDIYCWLNSDDYFLPNTLFTVVKAFKSSNAKFVYGNGYNLTKGNLIPNISSISFDRYIRIPTFIQPSCFWFASIHQPIWEELHCSMDYELWLRIVKGNKTKYINKFLSVALVHDKAKTHDPSEQAKNFWKEDHLKEITVHGDVPNWNQLVRENYYIQKIFRLFPFLKLLY